MGTQHLACASTLPCSVHLAPNPSSACREIAEAKEEELCHCLGSSHTDLLDEEGGKKGS